MRPLEAVLLAVTVLAAVWAVTPWRHQRVPAAAAAAALVVALVAQGVAEAPRWQIVPLQVAAGILALVALVTATQPRRLPGLRWLAVIAAVLALLGGTTGWALPVIALPGPSGPSPVGTVSLTLTDPDRSERYGPAPGTGPRQIVVQVWYPAAEAGPEDPAPVVPQPDDFGAAVAAELGLPRFALGHLDLLRSHATPDAAFDPGGTEERPLVLYAHGWTGFRTAQAGLLEELASHGYITAAVDHTYVAVATVFPDGRVVRRDADALPATGRGVNGASERLVDTLAADLELARRHLLGDAVEPIAGRIDPDQVALMGHSAGGGAAVLACAVDPCAAVVTFDAWVEPVSDDVVGAGLQTPLLSIRSEEWLATPNDKRLRRLHAANGAPEGRVDIAGTLHRDFTVLSLLSPATPLLGMTGDTPGEHTHGIVETWTRRFLDHHLRGQGTDPLESPPRFAESTLGKATDTP